MGGLARDRRIVRTRNVLPPRSTVSIFWGSPRVDERRRRRLAADADRSRRGRGSSARRGSSRSGNKGAAQLPFSLSEIVPASPLTHLLTLVFGVAVAVAFPLLGYYDTQLTAWTGPIVARLFYLGSFPLARWYGTLLLFASAQLSMLILWGRSHSQNDFRGTYRLWRTVSLFMIFDSLMLLNRGHTLWSKTLLHFWPEKVHGHETLVWVAPAIGLGYWITRRLLAEMRDCWSSWTTIALAAFFHLASVADLLDQRIVPAAWTPQFLEALRLGSLLLGQTFLFCGILFHARHVVYVSVEPPAENYGSYGLIGRLFAGLFYLVSFGWLRAILSGMADRRAARAKAAAKGRAARRAKVEEEAAEEDSSESESEEEESEDEQPAAGNWSKVGKRDVRIDPPEEAADEAHGDFSREDMRGLSKKERRKLLMQQREAERQKR